MKFLPLIWRNAVRNRLRTILTLAGIAFLLFVLIFVMTGLSEIQAWEGLEPGERPAARVAESRPAYRAPSRPRKRRG